ncbi:acyl-CoA oxidase 3 isoform X2 [Arctopsyche grandis]|uniref:acyl-CoA oxidase 3 isoform X2 n=1 Tax=Arctopsyche grandis TaxID=121162 RepID=UPI00406D7B48
MRVSVLRPLLSLSTRRLLAWSPHVPRPLIRMAATTADSRKMMDILPDFPVGPLTPWRQQASFDWRLMKLSIYDEESLRYIHDIWSFFESEKLFHMSPSTLSFDEQRHLALKRMKAMKTFGCMVPMERILANPKMLSAWCEALFTYDIDSAIKFSLSYSMFANVIRNLGTDKHYKYVEQSENEEIIGCFALTEVAHGSNAKGMKTTATYDVKNKQFVMNSPNFEAAKCWVGNLGQSATHAVVYAKLITSDGKDQGLHPFIIPVRCSKSLRPFPGVIVGDIGEKIGANGLDNGFMMFNSYRVSKDALLNKLGDVDEDGKYVSPIRDPNKRFGASLGALSGGRVQITGMAATNLQKAITIATRYSAVRKQFGPENSSEEFAVIEYQQQQFRLIPYIAASYIYRVFHIWFAEVYASFATDSVIGMTDNEKAAKGLEIHALSSASKPISSWAARDGIQVCREACGGHGYLQATGIGKIRNENDANCTYEGENSLLVQQTSNWLLSFMSNLEKGNKINTPYNSASYLNDINTILKSKHKISSLQEAVDTKVLLSAYKWLVCYMLKLTYDKTKRLSKEGLDSFSVRNDSQAYHAVTLSTVFVEHAMLEKFYEFTLGVQDRNCREVLMKLASLHGAWSLEKHLANLYMGGYFTGETGQLLRDGIINLCKALKPEAVTLVDTLAPPDFILNSVLGKSDGNVYQNLQSAIFSYPGALARPNWWRDVVKWESNEKSKL